MRLQAIAGIVSGTVIFAFAAGNAVGQTTAATTTTPIQHVVVILDENISFDHYFGTYPNALNPEGEPAFTPAANTPAVNGFTPAILQANGNAVPPFRLDRSQEVTCDNDNHYADEQTAYHGGMIDKVATVLSATGATCTPYLSMGYYDGNTVTAMWNYAQHFSMSDNFFGTEYGTTVMGHLNLISGQTHTTSVTTISGKVLNGSVIANVEAGFDDCVTATGNTPVQMTDKNVGDLLNAQNITWGWFYGDFPESTTGQPIALSACPSTYNSHYDPFQYYKSTSNQHHMPATSVLAIGQTDQANHEYALTDLLDALANGVLPAVTFVKANSVNTGHPANSTPLAEQGFLVETINALMQSPQWPTMAIFVTYDDSDGWYDHVMAPIVNPSSDGATDTLAGSALCGVSAAGNYQDRCGYGPRLPFLVISPYAKKNYVDHTLTDQTSILRFIEDNWNLGRIGDQSFDVLANPVLGHFNFTSAPSDATVILNPVTGAVTGKQGK